MFDGSQANSCFGSLIIIKISMSRFRSPLFQHKSAGGGAGEAPNAMNCGKGHLSQSLMLEISILRPYRCVGLPLPSFSSHGGH